MISTEELEAVTCRIKYKNGVGTGIFVGEGVLLTCRHVIEDLDREDVLELRIKSGRPFSASIGPICTKTDLAILYTNYKNPASATLIDCEVLQGIPYACHGHPNTTNGNTVGEQLHGQVTHFEQAIINEHDVSLSTTGTTLNANYRGYSGSGVINSQKQVFSIMRYRNENYLSAISIRKAAGFLKANNIEVKDAVLGDFSEYQANAFNTLDREIREHCVRMGKTVVSTITPQQILEHYSGNLLYPSTQKTVRDMVTMLMTRHDLNTTVWEGWLRLLAYVLLAGGNINDISKITLPLGDMVVSELDGEDVGGIIRNVTLTMRFQFTENIDFDSITCEYLYEKLDLAQISNDSCHVFNSANTLFGLKLLSAKRKQTIVKNIASGGGGVNIPGGSHFGVISLAKLNQAVGESDDPEEVKQKFKQLLTDVLKSS